MSTHTWLATDSPTSLIRSSFSKAIADLSGVSWNQHRDYKLRSQISSTPDCLSSVACFAQHRIYLTRVDLFVTSSVLLGRTHVLNCQGCAEFHLALSPRCTESNVAFSYTFLFHMAEAETMKTMNNLYPLSDSTHDPAYAYSPFLQC